MSNPTTVPGLWFTIKNACTSSVNGFAVGDELLLFEIGTATFTGKIFQGNLRPGEEVSCQAAADENGNGKIIFVPAPGYATAAIVVEVKPNSVVNVPESFCGMGGSNEDQLKK